MRFTPLAGVALLIGGGAFAGVAGMTHNMDGVAPGNASVMARAFGNGTVSSSVFLRGLGSDETFFVTPESATVAAPGVTLLDSSFSFARSVSVTTEVTQLDAQTFRVGVAWQALGGAGFVDDGATVNGLIIRQIGFTYGMSALGLFPGEALDLFDHNSFLEVIESSGNFFDIDGEILVSEGLSTANFDGGWGGRRILVATDGGDVTRFRLDRFESFVTYRIIPLPHTALIWGAAFAPLTIRRRRLAR